MSAFGGKADIVSGRNCRLHPSKEFQDVSHYLVEMFIEEEVAGIWI